MLVTMKLADSCWASVSILNIVSSRLMWVGVKIEPESWLFISANGPGSERSEQEIEAFWSELSECVGSFARNESMVVLGDLNAEWEMS